MSLQNHQHTVYKCKSVLQLHVDNNIASYNHHQKAYNDYVYLVKDYVQSVLFWYTLLLLPGNKTLDFELTQPQHYQLACSSVFVKL